MNETKKKALWLSLLGLVLGLGIGYVFHSLAGSEAVLSQPQNRTKLLLYFLLCALYGAVNMGFSAVYDIESWSILRCTLTHFLICAVDTLAFFGLLISFGWMRMPPLGISLLIGAAFVLVYFLIWLAQYLSYRKKVKKMNATLREWKKQRK